MIGFLQFIGRSRFIAERHGGTAIEYSLIAGLISIVIMVSAVNMGSTLNSAYSYFALTVAEAE